MENQTDDEILNWILKNEIKNSLGEPFEFVEHPFLIEPLIDWHPIQGVNKSAQVGWSETVGIVKAWYAAYAKKFNVIYTVPTDEFVKAFAGSKVDKIVDENALMGSRTDGGVYLKHIQTRDNNSRSIHFMGTFNSRSSEQKELSSKGISITADLLIHDERSRSDPFIVQQMQSRIENSKYKGTYSFDNPVYPKVGSDAIYQESDQRHWMVKCSKCNYWGYMDWYRLDKHDFVSGTNHHWVDVDKSKFVCGKCRREITDEDRLLGKWVAKYSTRKDMRGYWLNQLCYIRHDVKSLLRKEEDEEVATSQFYNFSLGKPYMGSDVRIGREQIVKLLSDETNTLVDNAMGVDQDSNYKWYVLINQQGIFQVGAVKTWKEIEMIKQKYQAIMVTDALPSTLEPKKLSEKYPGEVFRAYYKPESDQNKIYNFLNERKTTRPDVVLIRREEAIDEIANDINDLSLAIQAPLSELETFIEHLGNVVRVTEEDSQGNNRFVWSKINSKDHLLHALVYARGALLKASAGESSIIKPSQKRTYRNSVHTSNGKDMTSITEELLKKRK